METVVKKKTKVQSEKERYAYNRQLILMGAEWSIIQYNTFILDLGRAFLAEIYPPNGLRYARHYKKHAYSSVFWDWFFLEFKQYEATLLNWLSGKKIPLTLGFYTRKMDDIVIDKKVEHSFYINYLKLK